MFFFIFLLLFFFLFFLIFSHDRILLFFHTGLPSYLGHSYLLIIMVPAQTLPILLVPKKVKVTAWRFYMDNLYCRNDMSFDQTYFAVWVLIQIRSGKSIFHRFNISCFLSTLTIHTFHLGNHLPGYCRTEIAQIVFLTLIILLLAALIFPYGLSSKRSKNRTCIYNSLLPF